MKPRADRPARRHPRHGHRAPGLRHAARSTSVGRIDVVGLEGALQVADHEPKPLDAASKFPHEVAQIVNAPADRAGRRGDSDPVVAPPLYGRWHVLVTDRVDPGGMRNWVNELNLDPRFRAAAGLGARVIRADQEEYMKLAWEQVGEMLAANRQATSSRFAAGAAQKAFEKHLAPLPTERALADACAGLRAGDGTPSHDPRIWSRESRLPAAALSGAFRKPRGRAGCSPGAHCRSRSVARRARSRAAGRSTRERFGGAAPAAADRSDARARRAGRGAEAV